MSKTRKILWGLLIISLISVMPFQGMAEDFDWKQL